MRVADTLDHVWAKSPAHGQTEGETLAAHTGQVLARLASWRDRSPALPRLCGRTDLWDLAAWACLLHDMGKAARGFQAMLRGGPLFEDRHEVLSLVAVGCLDTPDEACGLVAAAVSTHHKDLTEILDQRYPYDAPQESQRLLDGLSPDEEEELRRWLKEHGLQDPVKLGFGPLPPLLPRPKAEALARAMRGLDALRISLARCDAITREAILVRFLRGLVVLADHAGSAHEPLRAAPTLDTPEALIAALKSGFSHGNDIRLWPHQEAASAIVGHLALCAPTGSGKTEAALLWAARQRAEGTGRPPIFYVLPYRASLNAMRCRIPERYGVPDSSVVLQHSSAATALYSHLLLEKDYTREAAARSARAEGNLGRLMTAPVRVLTPYQLLRAFFGLPGHEAMLTDAAGGLFILDELHAYDVARLSLILVAARHLARDLGARFLVMSATFPWVLRQVWDEMMGAKPLEVVAAAETQARFRRHRLRLRPADLTCPETVDDIAARVDAGEAVLVVATTVSRAQHLYDALRQRVGERAWLLHSRFTGEDRSRKEHALTRMVGTGRARPAEGTVLVATQVVEVSLDVDFDVLFSDPAPLEALLQRFGRVNRACRDGLKEVIVYETVPATSSFVYDGSRVARALEVLNAHGDQPIDEARVQAWVDEVYAPVADGWLCEVRRRVAEHEEALVRANRPLDSHPELAARFDELFDGAEVVPASLVDRYRRLLREEPLEAASLMVPVACAQRAQLQRSGRLRREKEGAMRFDIAVLPYDAERGLRLRASDDQP